MGVFSDTFQQQKKTVRFVRTSFVSGLERIMKWFTWTCELVWEITAVIPAITMSSFTHTSTRHAEEWVWKWSTFEFGLKTKTIKFHTLLLVKCTEKEYNEQSTVVTEFLWDANTYANRSLVKTIPLHDFRCVWLHSVIMSVYGQQGLSIILTSWSSEIQ